MTTPDIVGKHLSNETEARLRAEVERNTAPFRTPNIAGLCERLRHTVLTRSFCDTLEPINTDGPEAADTIERQAAEIERLREALVEFVEPWAHLHDVELFETCENQSEAIRILDARAALTGEDIPGSPTGQNTQPGLAFSGAGER